MSTNDFNANADEVGVERRYIGGSEIDQVISVEPPRPTPRWLLKLRALLRGGRHIGRSV